MPGGRPSSFKPEFVELAKGFALLGATNAEMADAFGISESTFYDWQNQFPEFLEAIKEGKVYADRQVATALFEKATGAEWVEEQAIKVKRVEYDNGKRVLETEDVKVVEVTKRAPPETAATIFWLKNRRSGGWRDKVEHEGHLEYRMAVPEHFLKV